MGTGRHSATCQKLLPQSRVSRVSVQHTATHTHLSYDRDRSKTVSTASNIKPILEFVQGNCADPDDTPTTPN
jgi:hypothetical protein